MSKIVVDETLRAKLDDLTVEKELCDQTGRILGHYVPADVYRQMLYDILKGQISDEEIERARQEAGVYTTAELLEYLKGL